MNIGGVEGGQFGGTVLMVRAGEIHFGVNSDVSGSSKTLNPTWRRSINLGDLPPQ